MPDKIVNHFVLADGSVARYDYDGLLNTEKIDTVVSELVKTTYSPNLVNPETVNIYHGRGAGNAWQANEDSRTLWLPCEGGELYTIYCLQPSGRFVTYACETPVETNNTFIQSWNSYLTSGGRVTYTMPSNANYIAVRYWDRGLDSFTADEALAGVMVAKGNVTEWQAYDETYSVEISEDDLSESLKEKINSAVVVNPLSTRNKIYGIQIDNSTGTVTRYADAVGLNTDYVIGTEFQNGGVNDFDNIFPWSDMRLCNLTETNGFKTVVYENETGFTRDGTNGDVMVEVPKFYTFRKIDGNIETICISGEKKSGFVLEPAFIDSDTGEELECIYVGVYLTGDGDTLNSKTNTDPLSNKSLLEYRAKGEMYDFVTLQALQKLFSIEFATINTSAIFGGLSNLPWSTSCRANETKTATNSAEFKGDVRLGYLYVGATISISSTTNQIQNRHVTALGDPTVTSSNTFRTVTFDGDPVDLTAETTLLYCSGQISGLTDSLPYHTGRMVGEHLATQFKYRNIEGLWGNLGEMMDGVRVRNLRAYWSNNRADYPDISKYNFISYEVPEHTGYDNSRGLVKKMGFDRRTPSINLPILLSNGDANYNTFYGDLFNSKYLTDENGNTISADIQFVGISSMAWDGNLQNGLYMYRFWSQETGKSWLYGTRMINRRK